MPLAQQPLKDNLNSPGTGVRHALLAKSVALDIRTSACLCLEIARLDGSFACGLDGSGEVGIGLVRVERVDEGGEGIDERAGGGTRACVGVELRERGGNCGGPFGGRQGTLAGVCFDESLSKCGEENSAERDEIDLAIVNSTINNLR